MPPLIISVRRDNVRLLNETEFSTSDHFIVGIDSEFVCLENEEYEYTSEGKSKMIKPSKLALARISVLRENEEPFIDDYIPISESIANYHTEFSGIKEGDLDASRSTHYLTPRKIAYQKIRALVQLGVTFVGHGLESDFRRMSNLFLSDIRPNCSRVTDM